jgi:virginiamycin B lyase
MVIGRWRWTSAAVLAVGCCCCFATPAGAYIYWTYSLGGEASGHIGRAKLDGSGVNQRFITLKKGALPWGVAVNGQHIYWVANAFPAVGTGRANLDGSGVRQGFLPVLRLNGVVTVNTALTVAGGHVYWPNDCCGSIGRANLDGTGVEEAFITGPPKSRPVSVTVAAGHIYWANEGSNTIGRANVDGSDVNQRFIVGAHLPDAVTVAGGHIYWANIPPHRSTIGRAKLDGSGVNQRFMTHTIGLALAAKGRYIYGSDFDDIWRAKLNGSAVDRHFIALPSEALGLAIN